jgi:endonuclease/exonuclease/phosphatase family metal-dependent hydrolase
MRLATFNILHGRHPADDHVDPALLAAAVRELDADVVALQEVDRNQARSAHADLTAVAAEAMGAVDHRFVAALDGSPGATWTAATGDQQPDAAAYGIALLSRYPVRGWQVSRLPPFPLRVPMWFRGSRIPTMVRDEPRVAVAAEIESPLGCVTVVNTHLSFLRSWNRRQLHRVVTSVATAPRPLLLVGDLNMGPASALAVTRLRALAEHPTFPADEPREQIDHVLLDGELTVMSTSAMRLPLSDHRALVVDVAET